MNKIQQSFAGLNLLDNLIANIEDKSDLMMQRARITFVNGWQLSVIRGPFSYGGKNGLYEMAVIKPDGSYCRESVGMIDDVIGWQTEEDVIAMANKVAQY